LNTVCAERRTAAFDYFLADGSISNGFNLEDLGLSCNSGGHSLRLLFLLRWKINLLTVGEEEARSLGINPVLIRGLAILASTLVTRPVLPYAHHRWSGLGYPAFGPQKWVVRITGCFFQLP
jgi:hypothetical protein